MEQIFNLLERKFEVKSVPSSERAELIGEFTDLLNAERSGTKYKKLLPSFVACKMSHISISDLYYFLKRCKEGDSFSKIWWGALKVK